MKAVRGKAVYTGNGVISGAYVVFDDGGKITDVSTARPGCEIIGEYESVTPAFIDAHSHIGLDRAGEPFDEADTNDKMNSLLFTLDVYDGIIMEDRSFKESVEFGVLYSCVLPGSGNIVGGKGAVIRNFASAKDEAYIKSGGIKAALGWNPKSTSEWKGERPTTRLGAVALLRSALESGRRMKELVAKGKKEKEELDPADDVVIRLLNREEKLRVHLHKEDDLNTLIRLKNEFGLNVVVEHACDFHRKESFERLSKENIPLVFGPIDSFPYKVELMHDSWRNVKFLIGSGVRYAVMTDHSVILQRNLFLQMRFFRRFGLSKEECISKITKNAAQILNIDDMVGTLEKGKMASFSCWNGDPFSLEAYPVLVYGEGKEVYRD
ncbi:MAG: amidohydrolase family protein [Candidatus Micrarchaeota archaeon]|nr:amidohydrolase family protein [Candidatus Micrarchaeota archaeon]